MLQCVFRPDADRGLVCPPSWIQVQFCETPNALALGVSRLARVWVDLHARGPIPHRGTVNLRASASTAITQSELTVQGDWVSTTAAEVPQGHRPLDPPLQSRRGQMHFIARSFPFSRSGPLAT